MSSAGTIPPGKQQTATPSATLLRPKALRDGQQRLMYQFPLLSLARFHGGYVLKGSTCMYCHSSRCTWAVALSTSSDLKHASGIR
jgi:hypothetical protein